MMVLVLPASVPWLDEISRIETASSSWSLAMIDIKSLSIVVCSNRSSLHCCLLQQELFTLLFVPTGALYIVVCSTRSSYFIFVYIDFEVWNWPKSLAPLGKYRSHLSSEEALLLDLSCPLHIYVRKKYWGSSEEVAFYTSMTSKSM